MLGSARLLSPTLLLALAACSACGPERPSEGRETDVGVPTSPAAPEPPRGDSPAPAPAPASSADAAPEAPSAPSGLACLAAHYGGTPRAEAGAWGLELPGGTRLPWDDARAKTFDERLAGPDLEDTLSIPYAAGPITPVTAKDHDPGRIRSDALFKSAFGGTEPAVRAELVDVTFVGQRVTFHKKAAPALARVSARLTTAIQGDASLRAYVAGTLGGTFEWRPIANTNRLSAHSYGIAIDIVVSKSNYWEWEKTPQGTFTWKNGIPQAIVDAFEAEGFAWGGRWYHYDTMHFEYRPELFDARCRP